MEKIRKDSSCVISDEQIIRWALEVVANKDELANSFYCACYACEKVFFPEEIKVYSPNESAYCPHCGRIAVIPIDSCFPISPKLLSQLSHIMRKEEDSVKRVRSKPDPEVSISGH